MKGYEIRFFVLSSTIMPILIIFIHICLKKDKKEKTIKNVKTACETAKGDKTDDSDSWKRLDTQLYS